MKETNYMQIVEQSHEEKMAMYMKCTKKKLAEMLIACNDYLSNKSLEITDMSDYYEEKSRERFLGEL